MLKIGIVGSGNMANRHASHWLKIPGVEIVGVASLDPESAAKIANSAGVSVFRSLSELLASCQPDIVDVCVPTFSHKTVALEAIGSGIHTFIEKPLALSVHECDDIINARDASGVKVMVGHVLRYFPEYEKANEVVRSGKLGQIAAVRTARLAGLPKGSWNNWYHDPSKSGGAVLDLIIHDFDWLRWSFGAVERVFAKGVFNRKEYLGRLDYALVTLKFASGAIGHVAGSWAHVGPFRTQFEVCGDQGMLEHDNTKCSSLTVSLRESASSGAGVAVPESPLLECSDPYYRELKSFANSVLTDTPPAVSLEDAREAVRIACAALESIETGLPVAL
jgi:predicted dehydrogenase